ncbi:MAG TPA: cytochrome b/b6 domain-containing protein, partial [Pseudobdellovibrionaceae bacterium]|nr:cytochrome b/b6 domain-containing protein [Pseudobdellovibrionaceae bacterium]
QEVNAGLEDTFWLKKDFSNYLTKPTSRACLSCHGEKTLENQPLLFSDSLESSLYWEYHLQKAQGSVYSAQKISQSHTNLNLKDHSDRAWDVHAQRQMSCTSCHNNKNSPTQLPFSKKNLPHLKIDPRKEVPIHQYLNQPNHEIKTASCTNCHDAQTTHKNFPYKNRHLESVSCQSCHIPEVQAPLLKSVNQWIVGPEGRPLFSYWNTLYDPNSEDPHKSQINTALVKPFEPFLLSNQKVLTPFNIVEKKVWLAKSSENSLFEITPEQLAKVLWQNEFNKKIIMDQVDLNHNQKIDKEEWKQIESSKDLNHLSIGDLLIKAGYNDPKPSITYEVIPISHGVVNGHLALKKCSACHGLESRLVNQNKEYSDWFNNSVKPTSKSSAQWPTVENYVIGTTRVQWIDWSGLIGLTGLMIVLLLHGFFRWKFRKRKKHHKVHSESSLQDLENHELEKVRMYGNFERFWHWTLALSTTVLLVTGFQIHYFGPDSFLDLKTATLLHNASAFLFFANSALSLIYYLSTKKITQFLPERYELTLNLVHQLRYYAYGMFVGEPHPPKTIDKKLNPLQQFTYLGLLNILLPLQVVTGILMWAIDKSDSVSSYLGGYSLVGPIHTAGSWAFLCFLVIHIYLTTTGTTVFTNIKSMLTGEEVILVPKNKKESHREKT